MSSHKLDEIMKKLIFRIQEGLPINARPYKNLSDELGLTEEEIIERLNWLREKQFLKRINFSFDLNKIGIVSSLVGCSIPENNIDNAQRVINGYGNITHNYLRKHKLNMWFTLSANSKKNLNASVSRLKKELLTDELISLPTEKVYKLRCCFHAE